MKKPLTCLLTLACLLGAGASFAQENETKQYAPYQRAVLNTMDEYLTAYKATPQDIADVEEGFKQTSARRAAGIRQNPFEYFERHGRDIPADTNVNLARFVNAMDQKVWQHKLTARFERLQKAVESNQTVFPGYTLIGQADLTAMDDETFSRLEKFLSAQTAQDAPEVKVEKIVKTHVQYVKRKVPTRVYMQMRGPGQKPRIVADVENRVITVLERGQKQKTREYVYPAPTY